MIDVLMTSLRLVAMSKTLCLFWSRPHLLFQHRICMQSAFRSQVSINQDLWPLRTAESVKCWLIFIRPRSPFPPKGRGTQRCGACGHSWPQGQAHISTRVIVLTHGLFVVAWEFSIHQSFHILEPSNKAKQ